MLFRSRSVVTDAGVVAAAVRVADGRIARIEPYDTAADIGEEVIDARNAMLLPGLVDTHVHLNDPGRDEWEGFESGTLAAAAGGVTTVVDMPLNSVPPTTSLEGLAAKRDRAAGRCTVDVGLWGGVVPGNADQLEPLWSAGVLGFKCFLVPSGVPEFEAVSESDLRLALPVLQRLGAPLLVHAELPAVIDAAAAQGGAASNRDYAAYVQSRPAAAEVDAVALMIRLCRDTRARIHIVHVSSADTLALLQDARAAGLPITAETCPHYLHFAADSVPDGRPEFKCAPPIRDAANREGLWQGLASGVLDFVASDHSPAPPALKRIAECDVRNAWGGIASLQLCLALVWTDARKRGFGIEDVVRWLASAPATFAGLGSKGHIAPGMDADLSIFDPDEEWTVDAAVLHHRHAVTPYHGATVRGRVRSTFLRGELIYDDGAPVGAPRGRIVTRSPASHP